jgi:hypothetical protein
MLLGIIVLIIIVSTFLINISPILINKNSFDGYKQFIKISDITRKISVSIYFLIILYLIIKIF